MHVQSPHRSGSLTAPRAGQELSSFRRISRVRYLLPFSLFHRNSRQIEPHADAGSTGLPTRDPCGSNILYTTATRIEDYELFLDHAPQLSACRKVGKFSMDLVFRHSPGAQRVVEIAAGSTSFDLNGEANRARNKQSNAIIAADVRRFSYLINMDQVFGTHTSRLR